MCFLRLLRVFVPCRQKRADIARVIPCENNFCTKYAHYLHFCGLQKLNTLNLRLFHPPLNPRNHFSTVLIETNWYTMICKYRNCTALTMLKIRAAVPPICEHSALNDINKETCTLYVVAESICDYQVADQWKDFIHIEKLNAHGDSKW